MIDRAIERALFEAWYKTEFAPSATGSSTEIAIREILRVAWLARASQPLKVRSQVIRNLWRSPQIGSSLDQFTEEFERWVRAEAVPVEVTEGYALVPLEPTTAMIEAYKSAAKGAVGRWCIGAYRAMITAALEGGR